MIQDPTCPAGEPAAVAAGSIHGADNPRVTQALEEYLAVLEAGQLPDRNQLQARYPDLAGLLEDYLDGLEFMHQSSLQLHTSSPELSEGTTSLSAGTMIPSPTDYEIIREVGRGGMGIVYEAVQQSLNRRVALKVLSLGATQDPRHLQRFKLEAQAAAQLQHPNIVPVFAVGCERGIHYYAMRFIDGTTLAAHIRDLRRQPGDSISSTACDSTGAEFIDGSTGSVNVNDPSYAMAGPSAPDQPDSPSDNFGPVCPIVRSDAFFRRVAWIGVQAAEALEHAHQSGVIHRDVKPANLLLDDQERVWVTDFGLARCSTDAALTVSGDMLGTLRYMSPEQASGGKNLVDHRTDVYSLGATLYELVTLSPVCRGDDHRGLLQEILNEDPVAPRRLCANIPRDLETILLKALGKQVEERYASAQQLADDLRRFQDGRAVLARRPGWKERAAKWARRHRSVVASAAAILVLSVLGLTVGTILIGREQAKTLAAYQLEAQARRTESEARLKETQARERAEQNYQQARQLVDTIAEIAAVDLAADAEPAKVRRKLLQAALAYYEDFLKQQDHNQLDREELLRGHSRVATILDAIGREKDARVVWNQVVHIALTSSDGQAAIRLIPRFRRLRLLRLASVQRELQLGPQQIEALARLGSRTGKDKGNEMENDALALLSAPQVARLNQLHVQQAGPWAFRDPAVKARLALTAQQCEAILAIQKDTQENSGKPGKSSTMNRFHRTLTAKQLASWHELVGEPFPGVLPPAELILSMGRFTINLAPAGTSRDPKKAVGGSR